MKSIHPLATGWQLCRLESGRPLNAETISALNSNELPGRARPLTPSRNEPGWVDCAMPSQVADILLEHNLIEDPRGLDKAKEYLWIAESDWAYRVTFALSQLTGGSRIRLQADGLDTLADIYLNGEKIASHDDIYLPLSVDITRQLKEENCLIFHFQSPHKYLESLELPEHWKGLVHKNRMIRKPHEDFNSFNGAFPYFTPIGIFDQIALVAIDKAEIEEVSIDYELDFHKRTVDLQIGVSVDGVDLDKGANVSCEIRARLLDPAGNVVAEQGKDVADGGAGIVFALEDVQLWWPRGYGGQPLYTVELELLKGGMLADKAARIIGFRDMKMGRDFDLRVNGVPVKLWGCNFAPVEQFTHVWPAGRISRLMDLAENANLVTLRIWGPGLPYGDNLYDEADRRGILIWSEFAHTWGMFPEGKKFFDKCRKEAEHQVRRLRHHPSIFMWCGANEVHMGSEMMHAGKAVLSRELYHEVYPEVCGRLDPRRYYHPDSPWGGAFANDPDYGDSHGYTHFWHVRGTDYPVLLTEHARWSPPQVKTLRQYIPEASALWPDGFESRIRHRRPPAPSASGVAGNDAAIDNRDIHHDGFLPPAWQLLGKGGHILNGRAGPIGDFYDTGDSPEGLVYRTGSAHSLFLRRELERFRRGNPFHLSHAPCRVKGHYWWRFNGTWPLIETELVDYLLEPKMAYYALRRAYAPLLLSFEIEDHIYLWLTNDTGRDVSGTVRFQVLGLESAEPVSVIEKPVCLEHDQSCVVCNLDQLGMITRNNALTASFFDDERTLLARTIDFANPERNLLFPDPQLKLKLAPPGMLEICSDTFARSVELKACGLDNGQDESVGIDLFGWIFEDNFFDLLPGEKRQIRILSHGERPADAPSLRQNSTLLPGGSNRVVIHAKSFFGTKQATVQIPGEQGEKGPSAVIW